MPTGKIKRGLTLTLPLTGKINEDYRVNWIVDNLPAATRVVRARLRARLLAACSPAAHCSLPTAHCPLPTATPSTALHCPSTALRPPPPSTLAQVEPATPTSSSRIITIYERGFPLGFKGSADIPGTQVTSDPNPNPHPYPDPDH